MAHSGRRAGGASDAVPAAPRPGSLSGRKQAKARLLSPATRASFLCEARRHRHGAVLAPAAPPPLHIFGLDRSTVATGRVLEKRLRAVKAYDSCRTCGEGEGHAFLAQLRRLLWEGGRVGELLAAQPRDGGGEVTGVDAHGPGDADVGKVATVHQAVRGRRGTRRGGRPRRGWS
jgi:hypothetical protein